MVELDRGKLIDLLDRLASVDDAVVLAAARELAEQMRSTGASWDVLLRRSFDDDDETDDPPDGDADDEDDAPAQATERANDRLLVDGLLARSDLSDDFRSELVDLRQAIEAGEFTAMDSRYVRAVAKRMAT